MYEGVLDPETREAGTEHRSRIPTRLLSSFADRGGFQTARRHEDASPGTSAWIKEHKSLVGLDVGLVVGDEKASIHGRGQLACDELDAVSPWLGSGEKEMGAGGSVACGRPLYGPARGWSAREPTRVFEPLSKVLRVCRNAECSKFLMVSRTCSLDPPPSVVRQIILAHQAVERACCVDACGSLYEPGEETGECSFVPPTSWSPRCMYASCFLGCVQWDAEDESELGDSRKVGMFPVRMTQRSLRGPDPVNPRCFLCSEFSSCVARAADGYSAGGCSFSRQSCPVRHK